MERNRVTVEYNYLPGQVFEHEADGVHCLVREVDGYSPPDLPLKQVLEVLELRLSSWPGDTAEFARPVTENEDSFYLVTPRSIAFDLWPRILWCSNRTCGSVFRVEQRRDIDQRECHVCKSGHYRQLPYYMVHSCGQRRQLQLPQCPTHGNSALAFEDTGSFVTAQFRCRKCLLPFGMEFMTCNCGRGASQNEKRFQLLTAKDSRAFYGHHLTLINVSSARLSRALNAPNGPHYALGHYLGPIADLSGLKAEIEGKIQAAPAEGVAQIIALVDALKLTDPASYAQAKSALDGLRGKDPGLEQVTALLSDAALVAARKDRRAMERAWLFMEAKIYRLDAVARRYRENSQAGMAMRLETGQERAQRLGLGRIAVIHEFPLAQIGFGFTRQYPNERAVLHALEPAATSHGRKHPLVTVEANTEGVYIELDAEVLWWWCRDNGWVSGPPPADDVAARAWLVNTTLGDPYSPAAVGIRRATHVFSHVMIQALAGRSSLGPNSVAEYLLEPLAAFVIYASSLSAFNLGALITLAEQHLDTWLTGASDQVRTCVHDPVCLMERGGCHKCIALAFGCERFNRGLHRGYLVGGGDAELGIRKGYLEVAEERVARPPRTDVDALPPAMLLDILDLVPGSGQRLTAGLRSLAEGTPIAPLTRWLDVPMDGDSSSALLRALGLAGVMSSTNGVRSDKARVLADDLELAAAVAVEAAARLPQPEAMIVMTSAESEDLRTVRRRLRIQPLVDVIRDVREDLVLVAPYWNVAGLERLRPAIECVLSRETAEMTLIAQGGRSQPTTAITWLRRFVADLTLDARRARLLVFEASSDTGAEVFLHAKFALADGDHGYLGSANMTSQGFAANLEIGTRLTRPDVLALRGILERFEALGMLRPAA